MRYMTFSILGLITVCFYGCGDMAAKRTPLSGDSVARVPVDLERKLEQVVTVEGTAKKTKIGAVVEMGSGMTYQIIYLDWLAHWPEDVEGKRVCVSGTLVKRYDMVFWDGRGEPPKGQFQKLPAGSDPHEASKRYLLKDFTWELSE